MPRRGDITTYQGLEKLITKFMARPDAVSLTEIWGGLIFKIGKDKDKQVWAIGYILSSCLTIDKSFLDKIFDILSCFKMESLTLLSLNEFDKMLAGKLNSDKKSRISIILQDHGYKHSVQPNIYTEPRELHTLTDILKMISRLVKYEYRIFSQDNDYETHYESFEHINFCVATIFSAFKLTFQTPQLFAVAAECLMDFIEKAFLIEAIYVQAENKFEFPILKGLEECMDQNSIDFETYQTFICMNYGKRLLKLTEKLEDFEDEDFKNCPKIYNLLKFSPN